MADRERFSLGLDVGSTKITAALMLQHGTEPPELLAFATQRKRFLKNGIVADLPAFQSAVESCLKEIRNLSKSAPGAATVNIHPEGLHSETGTGEMSLGRRRAVRDSDLVAIRRNNLFLQEDDLELVHVLEETMPRLAQEMLDLHTLYDKLREVTQVRLGDLAHDLKKRFGIKVITTTLNGEPFDAILDHLENTKPDLVVVGAHGKKGVKRMLLGSVSEKVARKCNITVTIVKTG